MSALTFAGAATAQTSPSSGEKRPTDTIAEVVVTAQKRSEKLQDVPLAITALSGAFLDHAGARSFEDLTEYTPSLHFDEAQSPGQADIAIRGVQSAGGSAGLEPEVGIYEDGVYLDRTFFGIGDFTDIARVEVLRGPQGTLFGKNTPSGVINFITDPASFTFSGNARATYGSFNTQQFAGTVTGPIIKDVLAGRISAFSNYHSGYITNDYDDAHVNDNNSWGVRAKLLYTPNSNLSVVVTGEHGEVSQNCCAPTFIDAGSGFLGVTSALGKPFPTSIIGSGDQTYYDGRFNYHHEINAVTVQADASVGTQNLTSISSYRTYNQSGYIDADFSELNFLNNLGGDRQIEQFSQELRVASPTTGPIEYIVGLYYLYKKGKEQDYANTGTDTPGILNIIGLGQISPLYETSRYELGGSIITSNSEAVFSQVKWKPTQSLSITGGLRYTYDQKTLEAYNATTEVIPVLFTPYNQQGEHAGGDLSGAVSVEYKFSPNIMSYASFTDGYKSFGFNDSLVNTSLGQKRFFKAELSQDFEVGVKGTAFDRRLSFDADLFHTAYHDFQVLGYTGTVFLLQNAPEATTQGLEANFTLHPVKGLELVSASTLLDAKFNSFPNGPGIDNAIQNLSGRPLQNAPRFAQSFVVEYRRPLVGDIDIYVHGEILYRTKVYTSQNLDPLLVQNAYSLLNFSGGVEKHDGTLGLQLWVKNATDVHVMEVGAEPPALYTVGTRVSWLNAPQVFGATLTTKF